MSTPGILIGTPSMTRLAINSNAGSETLFDIHNIVIAGGLKDEILPWSRIDIRSVGNLDIQYAGIPGEIAAGRYITLPGGAINAIVGPGSFGALYLRGATGATDTVEIAVYR